MDLKKLITLSIPEGDESKEALQKRIESIREFALSEVLGANESNKDFLEAISLLHSLLCTKSHNSEVAGHCTMYDLAEDNFKNKDEHFKHWVQKVRAMMLDYNINVNNLLITINNAVKMYQHVSGNPLLKLLVNDIALVESRRKKTK